MHRVPLQFLTVAAHSARLAEVNHFVLVEQELLAWCMAHIKNHIDMNTDYSKLLAMNACQCIWYIYIIMMLGCKYHIYIQYIYIYIIELHICKLYVPLNKKEQYVDTVYI